MPKRSPFIRNVIIALSWAEAQLKGELDNRPWLKDHLSFRGYVSQKDLELIVRVVNFSLENEHKDVAFRVACSMGEIIPARRAVGGTPWTRIL